ncbi:GNAT family N-acetyltransferase [Streptomyces sp. YS415]|uniref:GNAT family N-acetyltransferase n=1 Tax=Streptomyces sp. YS415 TaxID=2944806 RepID=UPI002020D83D|nr:GNAT family N-acetyltransferase [Streptomyces sp. YS415]MCL7428959.1 GNAT family N-acetyltransferase [Streptomyces sp. YS415]
MSALDLQRIVAFRASFARRQAAVVTEVPGGAAVLDPGYSASHEHNQLVIDGTPTPSALAALADTTLGHLPFRRITVLDDAVGNACAPALTAAGYGHETELVMTYNGTAAPPEAPAQTVALSELRAALIRQFRVWMPHAEDVVVNQLADRRSARLRGAEQVHFLAVRDENGIVGSWADLYIDATQGIAQIEDVVTADTHVRRGYADTILATALQHGSGYGLVFLLADPDGWPHAWYTRRGFTPLGRSHVFTQTTTPGPRSTE